jgi:hypothetical protein
MRREANVGFVLMLFTLAGGFRWPMRSHLKARGEKRRRALYHSRKPVNRTRMTARGNPVLSGQIPTVRRWATAMSRWRSMQPMS